MLSLLKNKSISPTALIVLFLFFVPFTIAAQEIIEIQVSPNVLNLQNQGQVVTIHTDIPYWTVLGSSVSLNDVEIASWKADAQGYFVAKFVMSAIKNLPLDIGEMNTMTLNGSKTNGETFTGSSEILVVNNIPSGRK